MILNLVALAFGLSASLHAHSESKPAKMPSESVGAPTALTEAERAIAREIGFDEKALSIVKMLTKSQLEKYMLNSQDNPDPEQARVQWKRKPLTSSEIAKLKKLARDFPELSLVIGRQIKFDADGPAADSASEAVRKRNAEFQKLIEPYAAHIAQEIDELKLSPGKGVVLRFQDSSSKSNEQIAEDLKKHFAGKPLADKYLPKPAIRFYFPAGKHPILTSADIEIPRKNQVTSKEDLDELIELLQKQLRPLGYTVYSIDSYERHESFQSMEAATSFANSLKIPQWQIYAHKNREWSFDAKLGSDGELNSGIDPDSKVERIDNNTFRLTRPASVSVNAELVPGVLVRERGTGSVDKFAYVRSVGSSGLNYSVDNNMIVEKLRKWDSLYGIRVLKADQDTVEVEFENLPDDISYLCTEIWLFCPDTLELSKDYCDTASKMRKFAKRLRESRRVGLWWD